MIDEITAYIVAILPSVITVILVIAFVEGILPTPICTSSAAQQLVLTQAVIFFINVLQTLSFLLQGYI